MINGWLNCLVSTDIDFSSVEMKGQFAAFPFCCVRAFAFHTSASSLEEILHTD